MTTNDRDEYRTALAEGRVVRYGTKGQHARCFRTFATITDARKFAERMAADGFDAVRLDARHGFWNHVRAGVRP